MDDIIVKGTEGQPGAGTGAGAGQPGAGTGSASEVSNLPSLTDDTVLWKEADGTPVTLKEAKAGNLRQADYSRKTDELAEGRKELEIFKGWLDNPNKSAFEKVKFIADQFGVSIQEAKAIKEGIDDTTPGDLDPNDPKDRIILNLMKRLDETGKRVEGFERNLGQRDVTSATREVEAEIAQVKDKYKGIDQDELTDIVSLGYANTKESLMQIADRYFGRFDKYHARKQKEYLEGKDKDGKKVPLTSGGVPSVPGGKKLSLDDGSAKRSLTESLIAGLKAAND